MGILLVAARARPNAETYTRMCISGALKSIIHKVLSRFNKWLAFQLLPQNVRRAIRQKRHEANPSKMTPTTEISPDRKKSGVLNAVETIQGVIQMSNFGTNGRFANQLFQLAFLSIYAKIHHLTVLLPENELPSILKTPVPSSPLIDLPKWKEGVDSNPESTRPFDWHSPQLSNSDVSGFFQFHTSSYRPYKDLFLQRLSFSEQMENQFKQGLHSLIGDNATLIAIHLRRGDFGYGYFFRSPASWYLEWLQTIMKHVIHPKLYIASDELDLCLEDFQEFSPLSIRDLPMDQDLLEPHCLDFLVLKHANFLAISNSSFSFLASMLSPNGSVFVRPHLPTQKLISFDPWNSPPLFRHTLTDFPL